MHRYCRRSYLNQWQCSPSPTNCQHKVHTKEILCDGNIIITLNSYTGVWTNLCLSLSFLSFRMMVSASLMSFVYTIKPNLVITFNPVCEADLNKLMYFCPSQFNINVTIQMAVHSPLLSLRSFQGSLSEGCSHIHVHVHAPKKVGFPIHLSSCDECMHASFTYVDFHWQHMYI